MQFEICAFCQEEKEIAFDDFGCVACADCYDKAVQATSKRASRLAYQEER